MVFQSYSQESNSAEQGAKISIQNIKKNSVYLETRFLTIAAYYERIMPIGKRTGLVAGAGIQQTVAFGSETNPIIKLEIMWGGTKHFIEGGGIIAPLGNDMSIVNPFLGYRFQGNKGFLFKIDLAVTFEIWTDKTTGEEELLAGVFPGICIGYAF